LMNCQMMRVISSPSSSTTVPSTLIFDMPGASGASVGDRDSFTSRYPGARLGRNPSRAAWTRWSERAS
ncbi:MAG: hypothetical protein ABJA87_14095, partial [bacterium]